MFKRILRKDKRVIARHRWLSLCIGFQGEPYVVATPGVFVVPIDDQDNVIFLNERSRVDGEQVLFLPAGATDGGESPAESANRELQEEIGYKAGRLDMLGKLTPLSRHSIWENTVYLARDLSPSQLTGDEGYALQTERVPLAEFESLISSERLTDATVIAALYMARSFIANKAN